MQDTITELSLARNIVPDNLMQDGNQRSFQKLSKLKDVLLLQPPSRAQSASLCFSFVSSFVWNIPLPPPLHLCLPAFVWHHGAFHCRT